MLAFGCCVIWDVCLMFNFAENYLLFLLVIIIIIIIDCWCWTFVFLQETEERKARLAAYKAKKSKSEAIKILFLFFAYFRFSKNTWLIVSSSKLIFSCFINFFLFCRTSGCCQIQHHLGHKACKQSWFPFYMRAESLPPLIFLFKPNMYLLNKF